MKSFDIKGMPVTQVQQYLQQVIWPRPIALVSTTDNNGRVNLSPFSFFNLFSTNPPVCVFSPCRRVRDNTTKHTLENLAEVPECVIHAVSFTMVQQCSLASSDYPKGVNEFEKAGFTMISSDTVRPPRVQESPVHLECKIRDVVSLGDGPGAGNLVLAEVIRFHIEEKVFNRAGGLDHQKLDLVARLGGDYYARTTDAGLFQVAKPVNGPGIGMDALPVYVRESPMLTGNDLAMLANVKELPASFATEIYLAARSDMVAQLAHLAAFPESRLSFIHQRAKQMLAKDQVQEAWLTLMAGSLYEQQLTQP